MQIYIQGYSLVSYSLLLKVKYCKQPECPVICMGSMALVVKNPLANSGCTRDVGSIAELGRSPRTGNGTPLQYSCLENSMDRGAWWAMVQGITKNWTQLSD